jgi:AmpD protein
MPDANFSAFNDDGWLCGAEHLKSPNFNARPTDARIDLLVIHSISLPPGKYGTGDVQRLFTNTLDPDAHPYFEQLRGLQVSAHFFITRRGKVWQFVSIWDRAWHAGQSNFRNRSNCNDFSIGVELEGLEGLHFTPSQMKQLAVLTTQLCQTAPIAHIAGHEHIAPGRKRDPGPGFDWNDYRSQVDRPQLGWPAP